MVCDGLCVVVVVVSTKTLLMLSVNKNINFFIRLKYFGKYFDMKNYFSSIRIWYLIIYWSVLFSTVAFLVCTENTCTLGIFFKYRNL